MKRQKAKNTIDDNVMKPRKFSDDAGIDIPLPQRTNSIPRYRNVLEAQIQEGDTLQAIAIRYNCSVSDLKRLNKIEREYEIHARKTLKVPLTPSTILVEHHPIVHKSGQSSPKHGNNNKSTLPKNDLNEKLLVAAVSLSTQAPCVSLTKQTSPDEPSINDIILNTKISRNSYTDNDDCLPEDANSSVEDYLLSGENVEPQPRLIPGNRKTDLTCSGSDCDMSWICLFICILALCFAIPLIYVIYIAEHPNEFHHGGSDASSSPSKTLHAKL